MVYFYIIMIEIVWLFLDLIWKRWFVLFSTQIKLIYNKMVNLLSIFWHPLSFSWDPLCNFQDPFSNCVISKIRCVIGCNFFDKFINNYEQIVGFVHFLVFWIEDTPPWGHLLNHPQDMGLSSMGSSPISSSTALTISSSRCSCLLPRLEFDLKKLICFIK